MALTDSLKTLLIATAQSLQGSARRLFMARTVKALGPGGQQRAARELRWGRMPIRQGLHALDSGVSCIDAFALRGRKRAEGPLPNLLTAIQALVESPSQAEPQFRTTRLYPRLTAAEGRRQLMAQKGSPEAGLPTAETIGTTLHALGYYPQKVAQSQPPKNSQKPLPSSTTERSSSRRPIRQTRWDVSRWRPRRPSQSGRWPGGARAGARPSPPTTTCPPRPP
jgi:hypothetical protein